MNKLLTCLLAVGFSTMAQADFQYKQPRNALSMTSIELHCDMVSQVAKYGASQAKKGKNLDWLEYEKQKFILTSSKYGASQAKALEDGYILRDPSLSAMFVYNVCMTKTDYQPL